MRDVSPYAAIFSAPDITFYYIGVSGFLNSVKLQALLQSAPNEYFRRLLNSIGTENITLEEIYNSQVESQASLVSGIDRQKGLLYYYIEHYRRVYPNRVLNKAVFDPITGKVKYYNLESTEALLDEYLSTPVIL